MDTKILDEIIPKRVIPLQKILKLFELKQEKMEQFLTKNLAGDFQNLPMTQRHKAAGNEYFRCH